MDNMELWNQVCETDPATTKQVAYGKRKFTAIDAQAQIKRATELWGPFGDKWSVTELDFAFHVPEGSNYAVYHASLVYPLGEKKQGRIYIYSDIEIYSNGKYNSDWTKKLATDALTKGLSKLGFNSDVFEGRFDDNKYVQEMKEKFGSNNKDTRNFKDEKHRVGEILNKNTHAFSEQELGDSRKYLLMNVKTLEKLDFFEKKLNGKIKKWEDSQPIAVQMEDDAASQQQDLDIF